MNLHDKEKINIKEIKINKANFYLNNTIEETMNKYNKKDDNNGE